MFASFIRFLKSPDFYKGFVLTLAILLVMSVSVWLGHVQIGLSITLGVFICAPPDVPGSTRHRVNGILAATLLGILATIIVNLGAYHLALLIPVMSLLVFLISYISVFGFRASLVSFSGLLAIILSFAHPLKGIDIFFHAGLIGLGGLWYLFLSYISHLLIYKKHTEHLMAECMALTARYLKTRGELALAKDEQNQLQRQLFKLQSEINEKHETLREILLSSKRKFGHSSFSRRQVLIFIELIDILELAIANLTNFRQIHDILEKHPQKIKPFLTLIFEMSRHLDHLSKVVAENHPLKVNTSIEALLQEAERNIDDYVKEEQVSEIDEAVLILRNTFEFVEKQAQKIESIEKVMRNVFEKEQIWLRKKDSTKFITHQDYDWKTFTDNLSFKSTIFRHSLRITVTFLAGFVIGHIFAVQNSYWILLTIVVIMRPGYSLTKERSMHRIYGTLIGAAIAVGVVLLTQNQYIYAVLASITFMLAFALVQKNYKSSAIFITLSIIFIYALFKPDAFEVIQYRVIDTLTGAALAIVANTFLWPSWEFLNIRSFISEAITANCRYLKQIDDYYHHKNNRDPSYKLSRKKAFLAIGNLNAAFSRMTQEPKSRQKNLATIFEIVVLNHTFLSLAASLGTYIHHHKTTAASHHFETYITSICDNLDISAKTLNQSELSKLESLDELHEAQDYLEKKYRQLRKRYDPEATAQSNLNLHPELQEVKHISDQLKWMYTISENLKKLVRSIYE